jgi:Protein of unknown function (DUF2690)
MPDREPDGPRLGMRVIEVLAAVMGILAFLEVLLAKKIPAEPYFVAVVVLGIAVGSIAAVVLVELISDRPESKALGIPLVAGIVLMIAAVVYIGGVTSGPPVLTGPTPAPSVLDRIHVSDQDDPFVKGCSKNSTVLDQQTVYLPDAKRPTTNTSRRVGTLELRYSSACDAAWANLAQIDTSLRVTVNRLDAYSPTDNRRAHLGPYDYVGTKPDIHSDVLRPSSACVRAEAAIGGGTTVQTICSKSP